MLITYKDLAYKIKIKIKIKNNIKIKNKLNLKKNEKKTIFDKN